MISIIYAYRNRDLARVKASLDSLALQTNTNFEVRFVDYGSEQKYVGLIYELLQNYSFVNYSYHPTQLQPWNKSKALNSIIRNLTTDYCFVADIDMLFHPQFVDSLHQLKHPQKATYFQVGFLSLNETKKTKPFSKYQIKFKSTEGATGMTLFPVLMLQELRGFDEFYHFWGAEDTDMHDRLRNYGVEVEFYNKELLIIHQWHPSYRSKETNQLSKELQLKGVVQLNHRRCLEALTEKKTVVNDENWGQVLTQVDIDKLIKTDKNYTISNIQDKIDYFLYMVLPFLDPNTYTFIFEQDPFQKSLKYHIKKRIGKKVPLYYSLKEINDRILLNMIVFNRKHIYTYEIRADLKQIILKILIK